MLNVLCQNCGKVKPKKDNKIIEIQKQQIKFYVLICDECKKKHIKT